MPERQSGKHAANARVALAAVAAAWACGCAHVRTAQPGMSVYAEGASGGKRANACPVLKALTQYSPCTGARLGYSTFEVHVRNLSGKPLRITGASLNGRRLALADTNALPARASSISFDGEELSLPMVWTRPDPEVTWLQCYPSPEMAPGGALVFQMNLRNRPTFQQRLTLADEQGRSFEFVVPRFARPEKLITAVTYSADGRRMYVQYRSKGVAVQRLWLNGREVPDYRVLPAGDAGLPETVGLCPPFAVAVGMPLELTLLFADGDARSAMVRALRGIVLDAEGNLAAQEREMFGLDTDSPVRLLPFDVTCQDAEEGTKGASARSVIGERLRAYAARKGELECIAYCTSMYPEVWNIYGPMADGVMAKPYRLGWGEDPRRFIEEEERCTEQARATAMPRPFFWIPERFAKRGRYLEPAELEMLAWMALMRGAKGIRYHFWKNPGPDVFADCPLLPEAVLRLNTTIREHADRLSPLALVSEQVAELPARPGAKEDCATGAASMRIYTAWAGDQGLVVMVRNLDYSTDARKDDQGRQPRFRATPKFAVRAPVKVPSWCRVDGAEDFLTGEPLTAGPCRGGALEVRIPRVDAYRLVWLANTARSQGEGVSL